MYPARAGGVVAVADVVLAAYVDYICPAREMLFHYFVFHDFFLYSRGYCGAGNDRRSLLLLPSEARKKPALLETMPGKPGEQAAPNLFYDSILEFF